ncbi:MAG: polyphosphate kinase 2, partial [Acidimicrobiales bacterium]
WTIVRSNDKKRGRVNAMRHVLDVVPYEGKDVDIVGRPDPLIVGTPEELPDHGESW